MLEGVRARQVPLGPRGGRDLQLAGGKSTFETPAKTRITCIAFSGDGEYTGASGESMQITFSGCTVGHGVECHSAGEAEGAIETSIVGGEIGFLEVTAGTVGVRLSPIQSSETDFADFSCAGAPERLAGSVVGQVKTVGKRSATIEVQFKGKKGVQAPAALEEGPRGSLTLISGSGESATTQPASLGAKIKQGGEALEVKNK